MPKKDAKIKRARAKPKNVIQKVIVNVGGRGGRASKTTAPSGPPRPTPLQTALEFARSFQPPRPVEPIVPPAQILQRLLDPINARLDAIARQAVSITNPPINIRQPDIFVAPPNVSINQRFPDINIQAFPNMEAHRDHNRQHVADLPDEPLVRPNAPLVLAGPMRMDDPHEDVPLNQVDPALVYGKYEAQEPTRTEETVSESDREEEFIPAQAGVRSIMDDIPIRRDTLDKMPLKRKQNTSPNTIVLTELASYLRLPLPRNVLAGGKSAVVDYILQNRKR
ncbi:MAG: hypothetical protein EBR30_25870 [Cytophagia bacterium]|nr:hypothetical protein [Cytophagia bacterium]